MIYVNDNYKNYKYLVEVSDNYVCLSDTRSVSADWQNPETIDVIYQYLSPSTYVIEGTKTYTSEKSFDIIETRQGFWDRADSSNIFYCGLVMTFFAVFIINQLTRIVKRGGLLG